MKKLIVFSIIVLLSAALYFYNYDPLNGTWISGKGDGYGLVVNKNAPFVAVFDDDVIIYQNKEYKIIAKNEQNDGRLFITTENFILKLKFNENGDITFAFPKIGMRKYSKQ